MSGPTSLLLPLISANLSKSHKARALLSQQMLLRLLHAYKLATWFLRPPGHPLLALGLGISNTGLFPHETLRTSMQALPQLPTRLTELGVPLGSGVALLRALSRPLLTLSSLLFGGT